MDMDMELKQIIWNNIKYDVTIKVPPVRVQPIITLSVSADPCSFGLGAENNQRTRTPTIYIPHINIVKSRAVLDNSTESVEIGAILEAEGIISFTGLSLPFDDKILPVIEIHSGDNTN
jgi:hypothetical protein